jgi:hypothetical protein
VIGITNPLCWIRPVGQCHHIMTRKFSPRQLRFHTTKIEAVRTVRGRCFSQRAAIDKRPRSAPPLKPIRPSRSLLFLYTFLYLRKDASRWSKEHCAGERSLRKLRNPFPIQGSLAQKTPHNSPQRLIDNEYMRGNGRAGKLQQQQQYHKSNSFSRD